MEGGEDSSANQKVNDEHEEWTERMGGAEGGMGEKEECGEEEKMEGGGSWREQELTGEKMSM